MEKGKTSEGEIPQGPRGALHFIFSQFPPIPIGLLIGLPLENCPRYFSWQNWQEEGDLLGRFRFAPNLRVVTGGVWSCLNFGPLFNWKSQFPREGSLPFKTAEIGFPGTPQGKGPGVGRVERG